MKRKLIPFFSVLLLLVPGNPSAAYKLVPPDTLKKWINDGTNFVFLLIDVRDPSEQTTVIATEACRPYAFAWNPGDTSSVFIKTISKFPKDTAIVVYCKSGVRSGKAAAKLDSSGFKTVYSLDGGTNGWGTRPTQPNSYIKPAEKLPEPSMGVKTIARRMLDRAESKAGMRFSDNTFYLSSPVAFRQSLRLFNVQGKCVVSIQDPFSKSTMLTVLPGAGEGVFLAQLESIDARSVMTVRLTR